MPYDPISQYCGKVCSMVRLKRYRAALRAELTAHLEDHADCLIASGMDAEEAKETAAKSMGDPYDLGAELDALHSPWYPRLSLIFTGLALFVLLTGMDWEYGALSYYRYAPFSSPHALLEETISQGILAVGDVKGGGTIGSYAFSRSGAAAIQKNPYPEYGGPYLLSVVISSQNPFFWLEGLDMAGLPVRLSSQAEEVPLSHSITLDEQGVFRRFYCVSFPVEPPFASRYTFDLGEGRELSYTVELREVEAP